ncbi:MAG: EAL domain-containing protein [Curvibacter lanceolatus]|uniref:bifunctional diguanylate cyclase/phosphodiesterase n=1 Tax=Curvibacter lanceolatus TaxID=86182 RepID=UPI0023579D0C|nr:EAL domain-containing protein [Curvibacter lanceolatus]MBV5293520.1 EAL domain-containing protein [Curvibacter lanceolatus]
MSVYSLQQTWQQTQIRVEVQTQNVANAIDQSVSDSIDKIDLVLRGFVDDAEAQLQRGHLDEDAMRATMTRYEQRMPEVEYFRITDREGFVVVGNQVNKHEKISAADRDYFKALSEQPDMGLYVSKPLAGKIIKIPMIVFARALKDPAGRFAGLVYGIISVEHFRHLLSRFQMGPHGSVILRDQDLGLIARAPAIADDPAGEIGNQQVSPELRSHVVSGIRAATILNSGGSDGIQRTITFHRLAKAPMVVIAGLATRDYLETWHREVFKAVTVVLGFLALSVLFAYFLLRMILRGKDLELAHEAALNRLLKIASRLPGMVFEFQMKPDGTFSFPYASDAIREIYRLDPEAVRCDANAVFDVFHPDDVASIRSSFMQSAAELTLWQHEYRVRYADGTERWLLGNAKPEHSVDGAVTWHGFITDITKRKQVESALVESEALFRLIFNHNLDAALLTRPNGSIVSANLEAQRMFGYSEDDFRRLGRDGLVDTCDPRLPAALAQRAKEGWFRGELTMVARDGRRFPAELSSSVFRSSDGSEMTSLLIRDITELKRLEQQLRIDATVFESQEGMLVTDAQGTILRVNKAFCAITGYSADEVMGRTSHILKSGRHDAAFYIDLWRKLKKHGYWEGEIWNRRKNNSIYPEWLTITAVKGRDDQVMNYVGTLTDITVRKQAEEEIKTLAFYDPLTQLPNRRLLLDRLHHAMAASSRSGQSCALLFIDLDNFKTLNDTRGHDVGDMLLQQVAQRLRGCLREGDTVSRIGGDEFVVILEGLPASPLDAASLAEQVGEEIRRELGQPYMLGGHSHHSSPSIGAAMFSGHQFSSDELLKRGDLAMYEAKAAGRNTLRFFDPQMQAQVSERARLEAELRQGLRDQQMLLHYQPQVDWRGQIFGVEALVRWQHPSRGLVLPGAFIGLAEETRLILELGEWVLETACRQLAAWAPIPGHCALSIAVNVSAQQFHQRDFVQRVQGSLERTGAEPSRLKLELTESLLVQDLPDVVRKMSQLQALGVRFSLDDFGTGYSSLAYLKQLPLDQLKIDQSFVRDVLVDANAATLARTIVSLADSLELQVIAEGVETVEQRDFLERSGCRYFQGYYFSRPMPLAALEALLSDLSGGVDGTTTASD